MAHVTRFAPTADPEPELGPGDGRQPDSDGSRAEPARGRFRRVISRHESCHSPTDRGEARDASGLLPVELTALSADILTP